MSWGYGSVVELLPGMWKALDSSQQIMAHYLPFYFVCTCTLSASYQITVFTENVA
jgi:hypothetical protein